MNANRFWKLFIFCILSFSLFGCADIAVQITRGLTMNGQEASAIFGMKRCMRRGYTYEECLGRVQDRGYTIPSQNYRVPAPKQKLPTLAPSRREISPPPIPVEESLVIETKSGKVIVKNFFITENARAIGKGKSMYAVLRDTPKFQILYIGLDQSFLITIKDENLSSARFLAEKELLNILGISQKDICRLLVAVTVPHDVSGNAAGSDYGLSFCPNGIPMPKNTGPDYH